ncbi:MAG: M12 family metallo-peptidase [Bacteroidia bacterium]
MAQSESTRFLWSESPGTLNFAEADIRADVFDSYSLDIHGLETFLAPVTADEGRLLSLPVPGGKWEEFQLYETEVMAPGLASRFPQIRTFAGKSVSGMYAVAADLSPAGFHAMISGGGRVVYIDPFSRIHSGVCLVYDKAGFRPDPDRVFDELDPLLPPAAEISLPPAGQNGQTETGYPLATESDGNRRTYRLAVAATGEYTAFHGGTVAGALSAIVTTINRVNSIYERELSIRLVLVSNNDLAIFTSTTADPFTNNNPALLVNQSQSTLDALIGTANYDLGHTFSTGSGGLAAMGVACFTGYKGQGVTGSPSPVGDPFAVDMVAHELAHQLGAHHTFNGSTGSCAGNRHAPTAFEPGSGTTIMGYAGICAGQNIQNHSDDYFHAASLGEIYAFTVTGIGNTCPVKTALNNQAPVANAGADYVIPVSTPFALTGSGSDPEGDPLTYTWEAYDLGAQAAPGDPNAPDGPLFRSVLPTSSPRRVFPSLMDIIAQTTTPGEVLPGIGRTLNFLFTARDNHTGGGRFAVDTVKVEVTALAGPFRITGPNAPGFSWSGGTPLTVSWDVANTNNSPVNCAQVDILLSVDGGLTFPYTLGTQLPNSGSAFVTLPNVDATQARVMVRSWGNIFFDISDADFTIKKVTRPVVRFKDTAYQVSESSATGADCERYLDLAVPVSLSMVPPQEVVVAMDVLTATTAVEGSDYIFPNGKQLTFPAGDSTAKNLMIRIRDDASHEAEEILSLALRVADTTRAEPGKVDKTIVKIADDDPDMTPATPVSTTLGNSRSFAFGPGAVLHFWDEVSGKRMLSLENQGQEDWGCVWVETDRAGTGSSPFWQSDSSHRFELADKTWYIYTENQPAGGSYRVTLYFTEDEVKGWETITQNTWKDLEVVLSPGAVSNITPSNREPDGKVTITPADSEKYTVAGYEVSAVFRSVMGGFGVGKTGVKGYKLDWFSFTGKYEEGSVVKLDWTTSSEQNMRFYQIERLEKGLGFVSVSGEIPAAGFSASNSSYTTTDSFPTEPYADYRIKAVFANDSVSYSELLRVETAYPLVSVYPNPFTDQLKVFVEGEGPAILLITSPTSGILFRDEWDISENSLIEIPLGHLPAGIYFYSVFNRGRSSGGMVIKRE